MLVGFIKLELVPLSLMEWLDSRVTLDAKTGIPVFEHREKLEYPTIRVWSSRRSIAGAILAPAENIGRGLSVRGGHVSASGERIVST